MTRMQTVMAVILIGRGRWYQYSSKTKLTVSPQLHVYCSDLTIFQFCERRIWISDTCTSQKLSIRCSNHVMGDTLEVNASENRAISIRRSLDLLDVNMPMVCGEGTKAFRRLQLEIIEQPKHLCVGKLARRCSMQLTRVVYFARLIGIDMTIYSGNR